MAEPLPPPSPPPPSRDCLPCRLTGSVTFAGVAAYLLRERTRVPPSSAGHRALLAGMSAAFAVASVVRWNT
jgi:hypothetical protein